jgi:hypothetical protein
MQTGKRVGFVLILVLLTVAAAQSAEGPAKFSNTRTASCLVKITSDPAVLPLSFESIDYLLHSSGVGGRAVREVLDLSPDQTGEFFTTNYMGSLGLDDSAPAALSQAALSRIEESGLNEEYDARYVEMMTEPGPIQTPASPGSPSLPRSTTPTVPTPTVRPTVRPGSSRTRGIESANRRIITATPPAPVAEQTYLFNLNVQLPENAKPVAEEFMDALIFHLRNALTNAFDEHSLRLKGRLQLAEEEAARVESDLRQKQDQLRETSGSYVLDRGSILGEISSLRNEIQQIEMRQTSDQITVDTTAKRIAEIQARIQVEMEKDTITDELKRLLALQDENVRNVEKLSASGRASTTDLADAQEKLTRARIELAQRQEQLNKSKGGNQIESLNNTLTNLSMGIAQYRAQLDGYAQQLAQAEALLGKADDYELLSLKADIAKQGLQEVLVWRDRISRQVRMLQPPAVSVIGGQ